MGLSCRECGYPLDQASGITLCPECGGGPADNAADNAVVEADRRELWRWLLAAAVFAVPCWASVLITACGAVAAYIVLGLPRARAIETGDHAVLDALAAWGAPAVVVSLPCMAISSICLLWSILVLAFGRSRPRRPWKYAVGMMFVVAPVVLEASLLMRLPATRVLTHWWPD